jgi:PAS domain S-box-containing protein
MPTPLNILVAEDSQDDADLQIDVLRSAGFDLKWKRVQTEKEFVAELGKQPDIVLSDYSMPQFNGLRAAELLRESGLDIPFILISGTVGEDVAVEAMRQGATDYLLKDRIARLGQAVERALREARERNELRRAEQELHVTHEKLQHLLEHNPAVVYTLKVEGEKVTPEIVSDSIERLLGFTAAESASYNWWVEGLHPEDRDRAVRIMAQALTQNGYSMEYRIRHKDGTYRWVEDNNRVLRDSSGNPSHMVGVWTDISERKHAEEVLRKVSRQETSRNKAGILWDLGVIFALSISSFGFLYYTNVLQATFDNFVVKYRNHLDELAGALVILILGFFVFACRQWKAVKSRVGDQANIEEALRRLHGELEKRIQLRTGELSKANDSLRNEIIERKRVEISLNLFRTLIDRSSDGIEVIDPGTGRFLDVNETSCQGLGYTRGELLSLSVADIEEVAVDAASWPKVVEEIRRTGFKIVEGRHKRKDGSTFPIEVNVRYVKLDREYLIASVRDITERKKTDAEIRAQLHELQRWHEAMLGREERVIELKREVNELLASQRLDRRYLETTTP